MKDMHDGPARLQSRRREEGDNKRVAALLDKLHQDAQERVSLRQVTEWRWIEDLYQYHGEDVDVHQSWPHTNGARARAKEERSHLLINMTRPKTNALAARLMDLLFPTDDRAWGIAPTPVPEMDTEEGTLTDQLDNLNAKHQQPHSPGAQPEAMPEADEQRSAVEEALADLQELKAEAKRKSDLMQAEIDDQLKSGCYQAHCRDAIEDACKLGTGILKGPVLSEKSHLRWKASEGGYSLARQMDLRPAFVRVDPWAFFPDPNARTVEECEGFFERHLMTKKELRRLAQREDMDTEAIRNLLKADPTEPAPEGMTQLFAITNDEAHQIKGKYQVWEYTGAFEPEDLEILMDVYEDADLAQELQEIDPLTEIYAKIWFCQNEVLSFALHPMESNESIYSVFNVERSETGLFGFGIPAIIRDPQKALTAAWRMMMDNARISAGPQIVINRDRIKPADNGQDETLRPFKVWNARNGETNAPAFESYQFEQNQPQLERIIMLAREMIDEMSSMPMIAQGEQGSGVTKTAQGMALLMNSANVVFRRMVKNWDDDMTVPNIRRMYDFNMQFSDKEQIKGDYEIDARGSSVLLVREIQSTNLMAIASTFADHPDYKHYIEKSELLRQLFKANMLPTTGIVRSDREADQSRSKEAAGAQADPMVQVKQEEIAFKREELEANVAIAEMERDARLKEAEYRYNAAMERIAADLNDRADERDLKGDQAVMAANDRSRAEEIKAQSAERRMAAEIEMKQRTGDSAGGSV